MSVPARRASDEPRPPAGPAAAQRALLELAAAAGSDASLAMVLERVAGAARTLVGDALVHVWLTSEDGCELRLATEVGGRPGPAGVTLRQAVPVDEGLVGFVAHSPEPVVIESLADDPRVAQPAWVRDQAIRSFAGVRLARGARVLGALCLLTRRPHPFQPIEVDFLRSFGAHAAAAIAGATLLEAAASRLRRLEALREIELEIAQQRDPDVLLATISRRAAELLDGDTAAVYLLEEGGDVVRPRAGHNRPAWMQTRTVPLGHGVAGTIAARREGMIVNDYPRSPLALPEFRDLCQAVVAQPLQAGTTLLGLILVTRNTSPRPFVPLDLVQLGDLAVQVSIAIENARLYEEARAHEREATRMLAELRRTQEQLVRMEKLRALGEMASGVAHDFNNVLAVILGRVQLLARRIEDPTLLRWLKIVEQAALDGAQTVRQVQEFTRVRRDPPTEQVDLLAVVRDAVELTRPRWQDEPGTRGVAVELTLALEPVPPLRGDPAQLREAVANLIVNAVEALTGGGTVRVATRLADGRAEIEVRDSGVGMSESVRRRIFEPFFSTKGPSGSGVGLGLAMVYGVVSRHGGEIVVESVEGRGSTFTVRLPVDRGPVPAPSAVGAPAVAAPGAGAPAVPGRPRVLVIDDEPLVRETLGEMLRQQQIDVVVSDDGAEGLARFRAEGFDVVITDLAMPGMSGWEVARAVKAARPQVAVVLVTGWGVEIPVEQRYANGVDRVLSKPFQLEEVLAILSSFGGGGLTGARAREGGTT